MLMTRAADLIRAAEHSGQRRAKFEAELAFTYARAGQIVKAQRQLNKAKDLYRHEPAS